VSGSAASFGDAAHLDDANDTDQRRHGFCGEITGEETPKESEAIAAPRIEGTLPLGLWFGRLERAPERVELEGEEEVYDGSGDGYEESDRSSRTEAANDLGTAPTSEGIEGDRPG
jgi:hypothetical protein